MTILIVFLFEDDHKHLTKPQNGLQCLAWKLINTSGERCGVSNNIDPVDTAMGCLQMYHVPRSVKENQR